MTGHRCRDDDDGSIVLETAIVAPAAIMVLLLIAFAGRITFARAQITEAARDAARAASLERDENSALNAATVMADRTLDQGGYQCVSHTVTPQITPDNGAVPASVSVSVSCDIALSDLGLLGLSGSTRRITADAVAVFDVYRANP